MQEIINTTFDKELNSFFGLDYISKDTKKAFGDLLSTFIKIPKPSDSDIRCLMVAFNIFKDSVLYNIKDKEIQIEATKHIELLKATLMIDIYRSREGFTRTIDKLYLIKE